MRVSLFGDLCVQAVVYVFHLVGNHRESASRGELIRRTNLHLDRFIPVSSARSGARVHLLPDHRGLSQLQDPHVIQQGHRIALRNAPCLPVCASVHHSTVANNCLQPHGRQYAAVARTSICSRAAAKCHVPQIAAKQHSETQCETDHLVSCAS